MTPTRVLRIGTRGSRLALWQAHAVADRLRSAGAHSEIVVIRTTGDRSQTAHVVGDDSKRQFVKEIEDALIRGDVDLAVHSAKDLPADLPDGLTLSACLPREDPRDAIVLPKGHAVAEWAGVVNRLSAPLAEDGPSIGTGSVRRIAQLRPAFPGATFTPIRGNVDTRLNKLDAGGFDALVLACAGLRRLGFADRVSFAIPFEQCVPAPGQGIVATETRTADDESRAVLDAVRDDEAAAALEAERTLVRVLGGNCQLPLGALAVRSGVELELHAVVASGDGSRSIRRVARSDGGAPADVGRRLAEDLIRAGARELLDETG
jgi:hydroxymethylbilane synthase